MNRYVALSNRASAPQSPGLRETTLSDLAGIAVSVFPHPRSRRARANRQSPAAKHRADHRRHAARRSGQSKDSGVYNSIYVIDHDGSIAAIYDKVHLVPFGEYLPFEQLLERLGLQELTEQRGGFLAGDRHRLIAIPGAPLALPLICYEIIFPGEATPAGKRPGWIVNVTNDGWFGISSGPYQHFQQARVTRDRARPAAGARRQYRNFRGGRSARTRSSIRCRWDAKACSTPLCRGRSPRRFMPASATRPPSSWSRSRSLLVVRRRLNGSDDAEDLSIARDARIDAATAHKLSS